MAKQRINGVIEPGYPAAPRCEHCKACPGALYLDNFWLCVRCAAIYMVRLGWESCA